MPISELLRCALIRGTALSLLQEGHAHRGRKDEWRRHHGPCSGPRLLLARPTRWAVIRSAHHAGLHNHTKPITVLSMACSFLCWAQCEGRSR